MVALVGIAGSETAKKAERAVSLRNWTAGEDNVQVAPGQEVIDKLFDET